AVLAPWRASPARGIAVSGPRGRPQSLVLARTLVDGLSRDRLGTSFRWLVGSSWVSNLGDGVAMAAGPLVLAALTQDARLVALGATVQWLPPLAFGLLAGAISDRLDRRDRKSTRLNSSHVKISYAVFCLKK